MDKILGKKFEVKVETVNICVGVIVLLVSLFLLCVGIPKFIGVGFGTAGTILTPRSFPRLIALFGLLLGGMVLWKGISEKKKRKTDAEAGKTVTFYVVSLAVALLCVVFIVGLKPLGYPIINIVTLFGMYFVSGGRKPLHGILMAVIFTIVSTWFFFAYLKLSIPMGLLEDLMYSLVY